MEKEENNVFKISWDGTDSLFPPDQVFKKNSYDFLVIKGGNLVDNEIEYQNLMATLEYLGETKFFIVENSISDGIDCREPFIGVLSTDSDFDSFMKMGQNFDPIFNWQTGHFFVFGENDKWGIYICEYPTINIIGCNKKYVNMFQKVYGIKGNGVDEVDGFISKEFKDNLHLKQELLKNYKLVE